MGQLTCSPAFLSAPVSQGNFIEIEVVQTAGSTHDTANVTTAATESLTSPLIANAFMEIGSVNFGASGHGAS